MCDCSDVYKSKAMIENFDEFLDNVFTPLFEVPAHFLSRFFRSLRRYFLEIDEIILIPR